MCLRPSPARVVARTKVSVLEIGQLIVAVDFTRLDFKCI